MKNRNFLPCSDTRCVSVLVFMVYAVVGYEMQHNQRCTFFCASFTPQNRKDRKMKVTCPECNQEYEVDESMRGQKVYCIKDNCPGEILVPKKMLKKRPTAATPQVPEKSFLNSPKNPSYVLIEKMQKMFDWQKRIFAFWIVLLLSSVLFSICAVNSSNDFYPAAAGVILGFCGVLLFVFMIQHWIFIHCGWSLVPRKDAVTTPNKAIWLNFVPGLMFFWNWVTYFELGRHYSELTGRRGNKVLALIMSVMTTLGGPVLLLAWFAMVLVMQGELLRSAEIIVKEKDFDD